MALKTFFHWEKNELNEMAAMDEALRKILSSVQGKTSSEIWHELVDQSPVSDPTTKPEGGHGHFRASWRVKQGSPSRYVPPKKSSSYSKPAPPTKSFDAARVGRPTFISNMISYAGKINKGHAVRRHPWATPGWVDRIFAKGARKMAKISKQELKRMRKLRKMGRNRLGQFARRG